MLAARALIAPVKIALSCDVAQMASTIRPAVGDIDTVVISSSSETLFGSVLDPSFAAYEHMLPSETAAATRLGRVFAPEMRAARTGWIVAVSGEASRSGVNEAARIASLTVLHAIVPAITREVGSPGTGVGRYRIIQLMQAAKLDTVAAAVMVAVTSHLPLVALAFALAWAVARPVVARDAVTDWTITADRLGQGNANWRTLAIMHQAMHDAVNAAQPAYARWHPAEADEPRVDPTLSRPVVAQAALAAAARQVLVLLHPDQLEEIERTNARALARTPDGKAEDAGIALGEAIGTAAVRRRAEDGFSQVRLFPTSTKQGGWRLVPQEFRNSSTTDIVPFLFSAADEVPPPSPPAIDSPRLRRDLEETRDIGGTQPGRRTPLESEAAAYWYYQSSQRGFIYLAIALMDANTSEVGFAAETRIMSQLATAMADSVILIWWEKEHFLYWRPITAIRTGVAGVAAVPDWSPMIETPPHPEYPSGHAADCFTGAAVLQSAFPGLSGPISYIAQPGRPPDGATMGMGQHSVLADSGIRAKRTYGGLAAMAEDCADSRIWAGAHFRASVDEARRVSQIIARRAMAAVPGF